MAPPTAFFRDAVRRWTASQFPAAMREVHSNLTGRMFRRRTGAMLGNVQSRSREIRDGFRLATTSPALIAWSKGSPRRAFWVAPKRARALSWVKDGVRRFSRGHMIPAWRFAPRRPALDDALERRKPRLLRAWAREAREAMRQAFPSEMVQGRFP